MCAPPPKEDSGNYRHRDILGSRYSPAEIKAVLKRAGSFRPFPGVGDDVYQTLPQSERKAIVAAAEEFLGYDWPTLTVMLYLDHYETGSLRDYQLAYFQCMKALGDLTLRGDSRGTGSLRSRCRQRSLCSMRADELCPARAS